MDATIFAQFGINGADKILWSLALKSTKSVTVSEEQEDDEENSL